MKVGRTKRTRKAVVDQGKGEYLFYIAKMIHGKTSEKFEKK